MTPRNINGSEASSETDKETAVIYPKNPFSNKTPSNLKYGGVLVVDKKGRRKKIEPKKDLEVPKVTVVKIKAQVIKKGNTE